VTRTSKGVAYAHEVPTIKTGLSNQVVGSTVTVIRDAADWVSSSENSTSEVPLVWVPLHSIPSSEK
jgi:hypothetical protein